MNGGQSFTFTEQAGIGHQFPGAAEVEAEAAEIVVQVFAAVPKQGEGVKHGAADAGEKGQDDHQDDKGN